MTGFTSGEFAQICGVKKATLFHYDQMGLLVPSMVASNGYRYYTDKDVFLYDVISVFREIGYSLDEIKGYLDRKNPEQFIALLEQGRRLLSEQREKIERMDRFFVSSIETSKTAIESPVGVVFFSECTEDYLIVHETALHPSSTDTETFIKVRDHIKYCREHNLGESMPVGLIVPKEHLSDDKIQEAWCFTKVDRTVADSHLRIKPAGTYAVLFHRGPLNTLDAACRTLCRGIAEKGCSVSGDVYEEDQLNFYSERDPDRYLVKLSVLVAKKDELGVEELLPPSP